MRPALKKWAKGSDRFFLGSVSPEFTVVSAATPYGSQQGTGGDSVLVNWISVSFSSIYSSGVTVSSLTSGSQQVIVYPS